METQNNPLPVSNDSLMPHADNPGNQDSHIIQPAAIAPAQTETRDFLTVSKSDFGVITDPKSRKWLMVLLVIAGLIGVFILYEYILYRSLIANSVQ